MAKDNKKVKRGVYLYLDGKEIKNDLASVDREVKKLSREIKQMTIGSEEYNKTAAKLKYLKGIIADHRKELAATNAQIKQNTFSMGKMVDWFNSFGGVIVSTIGMLTGVTLALRSFRNEKNKLETSQASLKALTGLDDDSIQWLTQQAKVLSTTMTKEGLRVRKSANEILDAYMLVGSAKPELLKNKQALADVTEEAMRLQTAAGDISLKEAADALTLSLNQYGAAADQAARFTNVLAAGSQAGAANIASQAATIRNAGVAAASANVSFEETVGLIQTLAYSGIKDEVAGTGLKKFFLVLQKGPDETNPKVVGLSKALENLSAKGMNAAEIAKMFGEEGFTTASIILQNTQKVKEFTDAVTDTNVAVQQASINSDTAAAKLDQARNNIKLAAADLGEMLAPAFTVTTNYATALVKTLPKLIDFFKQWGGLVLYLSGLIAVYSLRVKAVHAAMIAWNAITKIAKGIQLSYGIAMATVNGYTVTSISLLRKLSVVMAGHKRLLAVMRTATYLYAAAVNVLKLRFDLAAKSMRAALLVMKANPATLLVTALAAAGTALYAFRHKTKDAKKELKEFNTEIDTTKELLDKISGLETKSKNIRMLTPEQKQQLKQDIEQTAKEIDDYVTNSMIELKESWEKKRADIQNDSSLNGIAKRSALRGWEIDYDAAISEETKRLATYIERKKALQKSLSEIVNTSTGGKGISEEEAEKIRNAEMEAAELAHQQRLHDIKTRYLKDSSMTREEYNRQVMQSEMQLLDEKLKILGVEPLKRIQIQNQILDKQREFNQSLADEEKRNQDEKEQRDKVNAEKRFDELTRQYELYVEESTWRHLQEKTSEQEFQQELLDLQQDYFNSVLNDEIISQQKKNEIIALADKQRLKQAEDAAKKEEETNRRKFNVLSNFAQGFGESLAQLMTDSEYSFKNFLKNILKMSLDALERMMVLAVTERIIKNIATMGPLGMAKAAGEIALITAAFETGKALVSNFYDGGYTPSGEWDQPQGVVHSNEFVANRFAVRNPNIRPVLDLIDMAQRTGNVGNLTADDIQAVAAGRSSVTNNSSSVVNNYTNSGDMAELQSTLLVLAKTVKTLQKRLEKPITAATYINGEGGIKEAQELADTMSRNATSRKLN